MKIKYRIKDILHSGNSGKRWNAKIGKKYDIRRNSIIYEPNLLIGERANFEYCEFNEDGHYLCTTPVVAYEYVDGGGIIIETVNAIYLLERVWY